MEAQTRVEQAGAAQEIARIDITTMLMGSIGLSLGEGYIERIGGQVFFVMLR